MFACFYCLGVVYILGPQFSSSMTNLVSLYTYLRIIVYKCMPSFLPIAIVQWRRNHGWVMLRDTTWILLCRALVQAGLPLGAPLYHLPTPLYTSQRIAKSHMWSMYEHALDVSLASYIYKRTAETFSLH